MQQFLSTLTLAVVILVYKRFLDLQRKQQCLVYIVSITNSAVNGTKTVYDLVAVAAGVGDPGGVVDIKSHDCSASASLT